MPAYQLVLYPADTDAAATDVRSVTERLETLGLVGESFPLAGRTHLATGPRFLDLIAFLGCAPSIELDPPADPGTREKAALAGEFCHVHVTPAWDRPRHHTRHGGRGQVTARGFVEIWGIYPSEAVPAPALLDGLAELTGGPWKYFYAEAAARPADQPSPAPE